MTNVGLWFLSFAAFVSAAVIGWVAFLELTYQRGRWRSRKLAPAGFSGFQAAGTAREPVLHPRKRADVFRERVRSARAEAEVKISHTPAQVASLKARQVEGEQTPLQFCR